MKIYTKTGDDGTTGLFNGKRVAKYDLRVESYGTVDELNSIIGLVNSGEVPQPIKDDLTKISQLLFVLGTDLATPTEPPPKFKVDRINKNDIELLENLIDSYVEKLPILKSFILPGGSETSARLHVARTVARRAERLVVHLATVESVSSDVILFLNRLSDYLFTAARYANMLLDVPNVEREIR
ncbi:MAG: ATP:cob(I)alamin adenosyltransferase [Ignavibacteriae bacterium HGW-Ignavibacteriae-1]|jgi:cob(I)alamin adenosyltransferase|nr:MAG: ATP:cob(I)alamin adenosyltransferase [Ignavibacteriae bacterium HGW-Ignavibacteriae-1]